MILHERLKLRVGLFVLTASLVLVSESLYVSFMSLFGAVLLFYAVAHSPDDISVLSHMCTVRNNTVDNDESSIASAETLDMEYEANFQFVLEELQDKFSDTRRRHETKQLPKTVVISFSPPRVAADC